MPKLVGSVNGLFRPLRNAWMLEELGVPYEHEPARPRSAGAFAVNPFGKVPTLVIDGCTMYESIAINTHLGDMYRGVEGLPTLVPPPATPERARYEQLVCTMGSELDAQGLWIHRKHASEVARFIGAPNPEATEVARKHTARVLEVLGAELARSGGPYLLGADFSAADILLVHCLDWARSIGWDAAWPDAEYAERCRARPAYARAKALP